MATFLQESAKNRKPVTNSELCRGSVWVLPPVWVLPLRALFGCCH